MAMIDTLPRGIAKAVIAETPLSLRKLFRSYTTRAEEIDVELSTRAYRTSYTFGASDFMDLQQEKLGQLLAWAARTPYWRGHLGVAAGEQPRIGSISDIEQFPSTSRSTLIEAPLASRSNERLLGYYPTILGHTSGSTGQPLQFYRSPRSGIRTRALYRIIMEQAARAGGITPQSPRVLNLALFQQREVYPWVGFVPGLLLESGRRWRDDFYRFVEAARPDILYVNTAFLKRLHYWFEIDRFFYQLRAIVYIVHALEAREREITQKFFRCPLISLYGTQECSVIGVECPHRRDQFHVFPELGYAEVLDDAGRPTAGVGNVTYTYFENDVSPFIRYQLGDRGSIERSASCPCGRTSDLITFDGRVSDFIELSTGQAVIGKALFRTLDTLLAGKIWQYQLVQKGFELLTIRVVPMDTLRSEDEKAALAAVADLLEGGIRLTMERVPYLEPTPGGKVPQLVKCNLATRTGPGGKLLSSNC